MTFDPEQPRIPASIGDIALILTDHDAEPGQAQYEIQVLQADGSVFRVVRGNLEPHLTPAQRTTIVAFLAEIRTKAETELLPQE